LWGWLSAWGWGNEKGNSLLIVLFFYLIRDIMGRLDRIHGDLFRVLAVSLRFLGMFMNWFNGLFLWWRFRGGWWVSLGRCWFDNVRFVCRGGVLYDFLCFIISKSSYSKMFDLDWLGNERLIFKEVRVWAFIRWCCFKCYNFRDHRIYRNMIR
jgi:hypothetical protein